MTTTKIERSGVVHSRRIAGRYFRAALLGSAGLLLASPAFAQQAAGDASSVEEVVVTGSRIVANGFQQPTPVTVVGEQELKREMATTVANYLNELPSFGSPSSSTNPGVGVSGGGLSLLNLRNLGTGRTLVLLDNRRVVSSTPGGGVDTNTLPNRLVQRVEVVTGGASAAWGADAVAGVVNFVLNHDYEGLELGAQGGISEEGDDRSVNFDVTYGRQFAGGRGHVLASLDYSNAPQVVRVKSRDWWKNWAVVPNPAYTPGSGVPQRITVSGAGPVDLAEGGVILSGPLRGTQFVGPNGTPAPYRFGVNAGVLQWGGDAAYGTSGNRNLTNGLTYGNFFTHVDYELSDNITAYGEFSYGKSVVAADSLFYNRNNIAIRTDNAYLDPGVRAQLTALGQTTFNLGLMFVNGPPPGSRNQREVWRAVVGLDGQLKGDWKWGAYYQHGEAEVLTETYNNVLVPRFNLATDAVRDPANNSIVCRSTLTDRTNGCVPLNVFGNAVASQAAMQYVTGTVPFQLSNLELDVFSFDATGTVFTLPAGDVSLAVGGEYSKEKATATQDEASRLRQYFTGNFQPFTGSRDVKELFAETVIPIVRDVVLLRRLEINAAARVTDYSTSGRVTTWKVGLSNELTEDLRLRVTRSRDIRAPTLTNLFTGGSTGTQFVLDPFTMRQTQLLANTTGNPNLLPEEADTWTGGVVFRPSQVPGLGVSLDYYDIKVNGAISSLSAPQTVDRCFAGQTELCQFIIRDAAGVITQINLVPTNINVLATSGLDFEISYRHDIGPGALSVRALASRLLRFDETGADGVTRQLAGAIGDAVGNQPKFKGVVSATYDQGPASLTARVRVVGEAKLDNAWRQGIEVDDNSVPRFGYLDLRGGYKLNVFGSESELSFAVDNLLDSDPPRVAAVPATVPYVVVAPGTRLDLYDAIGRSYRIGFRAKF